jgi:tetratricopeptide (TPR) repeat protein
MNGLAELLRETERLDEAEQLHRDALALRRKLAGEESVEAAESMTNLAKVLHERKSPEAGELYERALAIAERPESEPSFTAMCMNNLAVWLAQQGQVERATAIAASAVTLCRERLPARHVMLAFALRNLGGFYLRTGHRDEAEPLLAESVAIFSARRGEHHPETERARDLLRRARKSRSPGG